MENAEYKDVFSLPAPHDGLWQKVPQLPFGNNDTMCTPVATLTSVHHRLKHGLLLIADMQGLVLVKWESFVFLE